MFPLLGGLISGGLGLLGSMFSSNQSADNTQATIAANQASQESAQNFNAAQTLQQENFQSQMSNTAYQRASADMKAAGLNPMMMFGSGSAASSPGGSAASISPMKYDYSGRTSAAAGAASALQSAIPTAVALKTADATIDNLVDQNAKIKAETLTEGQRPALVSAETGKLNTSMSKDVSERRNIEAQLPIIVDSATSAKNRSDMNPTVRKVLDVGAFSGGKAAETIAPVTNLISSAKGVRSLFSDRFYY